MPVPEFERIVGHRRNLSSSEPGTPVLNLRLLLSQQRPFHNISSFPDIKNYIQAHHAFQGFGHGGNDSAPGRRLGNDPASGPFGECRILGDLPGIEDEWRAVLARAGGPPERWFRRRSARQAPRWRAPACGLSPARPRRCGKRRRFRRRHRARSFPNPSAGWRRPRPRGRGRRATPASHHSLPAAPFSGRLRQFQFDRADQATGPELALDRRARDCTFDERRSEAAGCRLSALEDRLFPAIQP